LLVDLVDGRTIGVPLTWYPRLAHGRNAERSRWRLIGEGIHWLDLDEDISVEGSSLIGGRAKRRRPSNAGSKTDRPANIALEPTALD
jgi:hypothetical protein